MSWQKFISTEQQKPYFKTLQTFIDDEYQLATVYPPKSMIYSAFEECAFDEVKVVILGQDPYHGFGQAHGLSFSVNDGVRFPPSLRNILLEVEQDTGSPFPISGNLTRWASQGVLLLNDVLTVRESSAGSHQKKGWENFTQAAIEKISEEKKGVVFMLWGNHAQRKSKIIDANKHLILTAGHPSPMSANRGLWFGNKHFSQANSYLQQQGYATIDW